MRPTSPIDILAQSFSLVIPGLSEAKNPEPRARFAPLDALYASAGLLGSGFVFRTPRNDGLS